MLLCDYTTSRLVVDFCFTYLKLRDVKLSVGKNRLKRHSFNCYPSCHISAQFS